MALMLRCCYASIHLQSARLPSARVASAAVGALRAPDGPHFALLRAPGRAASSRAAGLVGLANVGKSTLFNALVRASLARAENFPFCTIAPNVAPVEVPDPRLDTLAALSKSAKKVRFPIEVHDIAGLIAGASKGEGLGNAFLGNIRSVHALIQVVRCFDDADVSEDIIHVMGSPDPVRDLQVIETELILADLQSVEKRLATGRKAKGAAAATAAQTNELLLRVKDVLEAGLPAYFLERSLDASHVFVWKGLQLLTQKPSLYVCNVAEKHVRSGNEHTRALTDALRQRLHDLSQACKSPPPSDSDVCQRVVLACAKLEAEAALLSDEDRAAFLNEYGLTSTSMDVVLQRTTRLLRLQTFYTTGPSESRAWCIPVGATAVEAAAAIHSQIADGFIRAEITSFDAYVRCGSDRRARESGDTRAEGREYVMADGDVALFRFNETAAKAT